MSPKWSPVHVDVTRGYATTKEPNVGSAVNTGRRLRATRVSTSTDPNSSARSPSPIANVPAKSPTLV